MRSRALRATPAGAPRLHARWSSSHSAASERSGTTHLASLESLDAQIAAVEKRNRQLELAVAPPKVGSSMWKLPQTYADTRRPVAQALSLNPASYYDPEYHAAELEELWQKKWFAAESIQMFGQHGDTQVVEVGSNSFIITMDRNLQLHAFHNVCRHRGSRLCNKGGNRKRLNCPYHHWSYNLRGELVGTPHFDQPHFSRQMNSLYPVRVERFAGLVWLCVDPSAGSLAEQLGTSSEGLACLDRFPFGEMEIIGSKEYRVNCDWKLLAENFLEFYHLNAVHPELAKYSTPEKHKGNQFHGNYVGYCTNPVTDSGSCVDLSQFNPNPGGEALNTPELQAHETAFFYQLFPNVSVSVFPNFVYTLICLPAGAEKTVEKMTVLQHPRSRLESDSDAQFRAKQADVMAFVSEVNQQDVDICERVGLGVRQGAYGGGVFSPSMEGTVYRFQNMVADALTGASPGAYPAVMDDYSRMLAGRS